MKFTENHYVNVQGWPQELVEEAAQVMSEQTEVKICMDKFLLKPHCCYQFLRIAPTNNGERIYVYCSHSSRHVELSREDVEQIIQHHKHGKIAQSSNTVLHLTREPNHPHITSAAHTLAKAGDKLQQLLEWQQEANQRVEVAEKEYQDALKGMEEVL